MEPWIAPILEAPVLPYKYGVKPQVSSGIGGFRGCTIALHQLPPCGASLVPSVRLSSFTLPHDLTAGTLLSKKAPGKSGVPLTAHSFMLVAGVCARTHI